MSRVLRTKQYSFLCSTLSILTSPLPLQAGYVNKPPTSACFCLPSQPAARWASSRPPDGRASTTSVSWLLWEADFACRINSLVFASLDLLGVARLQKLSAFHKSFERHLSPEQYKFSRRSQESNQGPTMDKPGA
jgi:hypothetical protein